MNDIEITLQNYRSFSLDSQVTLRISEGISIILGVNNVGKSTLLKIFYELRPLINISALDTVRSQIASQAYDVAVNDNSRPPFDQMSHRSSTKSPITLILKENNGGFRMSFLPKSADFNTRHYKVQLDRLGNPTEEFVNKVNSLFHESMYIGSFRSTKGQIQSTSYDIDIGNNFITKWDQWANGENIEHRTKIDELTQELGTLFGFKRFEISVSHQNNKLLLKTDDGTFSLDELGDGIAHLILVLGNAMIREPAFIFIDEPEIGLHPKMQETFVRTLASKTKFGLVATSHSVALARSVADHIFTLTREPDGRRHFLPFGEHHPATLMQSISELGYSQYADIGGNHLLLVEGRTDIKSFREILRKFGIEQHFLIWSLGGSEWLAGKLAKIIDELNEVKRLNALSYSVIFDSEVTDASMLVAPRFEEFLEACKSLGFNVFPTDRHSTENYITQSALDKLAPNHKALEKYEVFGSKSKKWPKTINWRLFSEMKREDFDNTGLKYFIEGTLALAVSKSPLTGGTP